MSGPHSFTHIHTQTLCLSGREQRSLFDGVKCERASHFSYSRRTTTTKKKHKNDEAVVLQLPIVVYLGFSVVHRGEHWTRVECAQAFLPNRFRCYRHFGVHTHTHTHASLASHETRTLAIKRVYSDEIIISLSCRAKNNGNDEKNCKMNDALRNAEQIERGMFGVCVHLVTE